MHQLEGKLTRTCVWNHTSPSSAFGVLFKDTGELHFPGVRLLISLLWYHPMHRSIRSELSWSSPPQFHEISFPFFCIPLPSFEFTLLHHSISPTWSTNFPCTGADKSGFYRSFPTYTPLGDPIYRLGDSTLICGSRVVAPISLAGQSRSDCLWPVLTSTTVNCANPAASQRCGIWVSAVYPRRFQCVWWSIPWLVSLPSAPSFIRRLRRNLYYWSGWGPSCRVGHHSYYLLWLCVSRLRHKAELGGVSNPYVRHTRDFSIESIATSLVLVPTAPESL